VYLSDPNEAAIKHVREAHPEVQICSVNELYQQDVDVFSPNAIGGIITDEIARNLSAKILAGGANNPLASEEAALILHERGILYAPDFVINAGGVIMVACEIEKKGFEEAQRKTEAIYDTTLGVFEYAKQKNLPPWEAARLMAVERIEKAKAGGKKKDKDTGSGKTAALC
jgi:glutamate dehydrogenase/leucine dehydrogenase